MGKGLLDTKIIKACVALAVAALLFYGGQVRLPFVDQQTDQYFLTAISKAGMAYATCRIVNASVSVLKESTIQLEPAGVGVSLALGQALDPIDDMTERLSDVLVTAITALGVQKLIYEISQVLALKILAVLLVFWVLFYLIDSVRFERIKKMILGLLILMAIVRLTLPMSAMASAFIHQHFFEERITTASESLKGGIKDLDHLKEIALPQIDGIKGTIENSAFFLKQKIHALKTGMAAMTKNMGMLIDTLLTLTFLYMGIFFIQVIMLPILTFWLLAKIIHAFFDIRLSILTNDLNKGDDHAVCEH
jgi:hypothetical protein